MKYALSAALIAFAPVVAFAQDIEQLPAPQAAATPQDRTISWYMAHETERKARIAVCDNDPGHLKDDPDCINAKKADNQAGVNDFKAGVDNTIQGAANFFQGK
jgi:hypothetical protein